MDNYTKIKILKYVANSTCIMTEMNDLDIYNQKLEKYMSSIHNSNYIFELTKTCGYGEFLIIRKDSTLLDLYKTVSIESTYGHIHRLFVKNSDTFENITIPINEQLTIREFINNNNFIRPVYNISCPVVYVIYLDDGFYHEHTCTKCICKCNC